jgi:hypothetical protein
MPTYVAIRNVCLMSIGDIQSLTATFRSRGPALAWPSFNQRPLFALDHPKPPVCFRPRDLYGAIGVKGVVTGHLLVRLACDISLSRPDFRSGAAVKGGQSNRAATCP